MIVSKHYFCHGVVSNAPKLISVMATYPVLAVRQFTGSGAPTSSTLMAGNGMYCATTSGFLFAASLVSPGSGYSVGDNLTIFGGTASTAMVLKVAAVTSSGGILDFRTNTVGNYSVYPTNAAGVTGGTGTGASFDVAIQPADQYLDTSSQSLYVCTISGTNSTSIWKKISGGGTQQFKVVSDGGDYWNCNTFDGTTTGSTIVKVAKPHRIRAVNGISSETIRGILMNYAYTAVSGTTTDGVNVLEYTRTVSTGVNETDYMTPYCGPGAIIVAESYSCVAPSTLVGVSWIFNSCHWSSPS